MFLPGKQVFKDQVPYTKNDCFTSSVRECGPYKPRKTERLWCCWSCTKGRLTHTVHVGVIEPRRTVALGDWRQEIGSV